MPRTVLAVRCASILPRSKSSPMRKPAASCAVVIVHLMLCRKRFDHHWRPRLIMRILIGGASLLLVIAAVFLTFLVFPERRLSYGATVSVNEQAPRLDIFIVCQPSSCYISPTTL